MGVDEMPHVLWIRTRTTTKTRYGSKMRVYEFLEKIWLPRETGSYAINSFVLQISFFVILYCCCRFPVFSVSRTTMPGVVPWFADVFARFHA